MAKSIQDYSDEIWKPVVGYEGLYEVSDHGRVRSLDRLVCVVRGDKAFGSLRRGRVLKLMLDRDGYPFVNLASPDVPHKKHFVHWLVLEAFVEPRPDGMQACHNDGCKTSNAPANLRWGGSADNGADKARHGSAKGAKNPKATLAEDDVLAIRECIQNGATDYELAAAYDCSPGTIWFIRHRRTWAHLS